jgi:hypothetical protein
MTVTGSPCSHEETRAENEKKLFEEDAKYGSSIPLQCIKCDYTCTGIERMGEHLREEHNDWQSSVYQTSNCSEPDRIIHTCDVCGRECTSTMFMLRHLYLYHLSNITTNDPKYRLL